jgi:transposase-like protein
LIIIAARSPISGPFILCLVLKNPYREGRKYMNEKEKAKFKVPLRESYSEAFKRKVVMEVENGILSKDGAKYHYGISGNSQVLDWCRKYGRLRHPQTETRTVMPKKIHEDVRTQLERRVKELEKALQEATTKVEVYESLLEVAKEKTGIDIKKNFGTRPSSESDGAGREKVS